VAEAATRKDAAGSWDVVGSACYSAKWSMSGGGRDSRERPCGSRRLRMLQHRADEASDGWNREAGFRRRTRDRAMEKAGGTRKLSKSRKRYLLEQ